MTTSRSICSIAREISDLWPKPFFGAVPYIRAMASLNTVSDKFGQDDARSIVIYFLGNAKNWRGDDARRLKAELKEIVGIK